MENKMVLDHIANHVVDKLLNDCSIVEIQNSHTLKSLDVRRFAQISCAIEAGQFYNDHLYNRPFFSSYIDHLKYVGNLASKSGNGLFLEFGVATGTTLRAVAEATGRNVVGFDSFRGLPENWRDGADAGAGAFACNPPAVPHGSSLEVGMIEDRLENFLSAHPEEEIQFIHTDTDLYGPAKFILDTCKQRIKNTFIVFDEFFNYPGYRHHEYKAWEEFQAYNSHMFDFDYVALGGTVAVSVRVTRKS